MKLPPTKFSNKINQLISDGIIESFDFNNWESSPEWALFVEGFAHCQDKTIQAVALDIKAQ